MFLKLEACWCVLGSPENGSYYSMNVCIPPNPYVEILASNVMVSGGRTSERGLGHEGGVLMNEISGLIKGTPERACISSTM